MCGDQLGHQRCEDVFTWYNYDINAIRLHCRTVMIQCDITMYEDDVIITHTHTHTNHTHNTHTCA